MSGKQVAGAASKPRSDPSGSIPTHRVSSWVPSYGRASSSNRPVGLMPSLRRQTAQKDVEMHPRDPSSNIAKDNRPQNQHDIEDPYFIADYLAGNTSKAAAVFRRYDRLVMYRLVSLSRDLNSLEEKHDEYVANQGKGGWSAEDLNNLHDEDDFVGKIKEYCRELSYVQINGVFY